MCGSRSGTVGPGRGHLLGLVALLMVATVAAADANKVHCYHSWSGGTSIYNFTLKDILGQEDIPLSK